MQIEQVDLGYSPVQCIGGERVGLVILALRGIFSHVRGFGVILPYRGRGLSHALMDERIRSAQRAGAEHLSLGVMVKSERAVKAYLGAGMQIEREISTFEWESSERQTRPTEIIVHADPRALLTHFDLFHPVPATWNRAFPS